MGCSSSVQVSSPTKASGNKTVPTKKRSSLDKTPDYSSLENLKSIDEVPRRFSVLTVRSGNVKMHQCSENDSPQTKCRQMEYTVTANTPSAAVRSMNGRPIPVDSPAPFRKNYPANGNAIYSPSRLRALKRNPLLSPASQRFVTSSLPTSPLVRVKERPEPNSRSPSLDVQSEKNFGSIDETKQALDKALKELSKSLSDSHGSIFHVDSEDRHDSPNNSVSAHSTSPEQARLSRTTYDASCVQHSKIVVMDIGSGCCKAGLSNDDVPSVVIPTLVGRPKSDDTFPGMSRDTTFVGNDVKLRRGVLSLSRPVQRGVVQDWDDWSAVVDHVLNMELKVEMDDISTVLPEYPFCSRQHKEKKAEILFENFHLSKLYLGSSAPMAMHAFGMTSGLLVSVGHDVTSCVPVVQGNVQNEGIRTLELGGSDITKQLKDLIKNLHINGMKHDNDQSISKAMMERLCYVTNGASDNDNAVTTPKQRTYSLPNGATVNLDKERFTAPEILFDPHILGDNYASVPGLQKMCFSSVEACSESHSDDVIKELYKNIVLTGGTSLLSGLAQRLKNEVADLVPRLPGDFINVHSLPKRQYAVWRGASFMTSLQLSRGRWITKVEFDEHGPSIVHRNFNGQRHGSEFLLQSLLKEKLPLATFICNHFIFALVPGC